nr:putative ribonuclease H-like domain-containing protein [Tanacetum cinerariifolium]
MEFESTQNNTTAKLLILKLGEYELWVKRIKQYFQVQDCEVIENGNSWVSVTHSTQENGVSITKMSVPATAEEKINKKNDVKARSLLLMALSNEHQLTFSQYNDAKTILQKIISRLEVLGLVITQEDLNSKFLRSLPPEWNTHVVVWMNKTDIKTVSIDDLYNNFKIIKQDVKRSVGTSIGSQNMAFMTAPSTSSTNNVNIANSTYEARSTSGIRACALRNFNLQVMEFESTQNNTTAKLLILKLGEYELWVIRIKQYFQVQDYEVIKNGNSWVSVTHSKQENGVSITKMPKIEDNDSFELKGQFLKKLRDNTFSGSDHEDANEHIDKVLVIVDLFHIPNITIDQLMLRTFPMSLTGAVSRWLRNKPSEMKEVVLFYNGLDVPTRQILDSRGVIPSKTAADAKQLRMKPVRSLRILLKEIKNLVDKKVKIIRCDNGIEFKNKVMDDFYREKGKFNGKSDEGFFVGYSLSSKAFRVYNTRTMKVEETLHIGVLENKPMKKRNGPKWLFNIDSLTQSLNYVPVAAGTILDESAGTQGHLNTGTSSGKEATSQDYIVMPIWKDSSYFDTPSKDVEDGTHNENDDKDKSKDDSSPKEVNAARQHVNTASLEVNTRCFELNTVDPSLNTASLSDPHSHIDMFKLGASDTLEATHVEFFSDRDAPKVDFGNILNSYRVPTTSHTIIHEDKPVKNVIGEIEPTSIAKALSDSSWVEAMHKELLQFKLQQVWIVMDLPYGKKAIGTKWVFRNKKDKKGIMIRNKARLVAQGHRQEEGIDYEEVFAHVARIKAIRLFLAYVSFMGFLVYQMDVRSAFLYGTIEEEVYVTQKPGFKDPNHLDKVYKVVKALYRLHQAPIACHDKYVKDILKKLNYSDVKFASTPVDLEKPLVKDGDVNDIDVHLYRSIIGSLMYLTASRPDILFAVCASARFQVTPKTSHLLVVKRILRYLKGKPTLGLWYPRDSPFELVAYTDSDYAIATQDRKSTTGVIYVSLIRQFWETISLSTSENREIKITATIDGRVKSVTEASIRRNLKLEYSEGIRGSLNLTKALMLLLPSQKLFSNMRRASKGYSEVDVPLFPIMLVQGLILQSDPTISPPPISSPLRVPTSPHDSPLLGGNTHGSEEGRMTLNELMVFCTSLSKKVESLESNLKQTKLTYSAAYTKLTMKVKKLENKRRKIAQIDEDEGITLVQMGAQTQGRNEHEVESDFDFTTAKDISTTNVPVTTACAENSTASPEDKTAEPLMILMTLLGQKQEEATIAILTKEFDEIQARMDVDYELATRLTYEEQEQFTIKERAK